MREYRAAWPLGSWQLGETCGHALGSDTVSHARGLQGELLPDGQSQMRQQDLEILGGPLERDEEVQQPCWRGSKMGLSDINPNSSASLGQEDLGTSGIIF